METKLSTKDLVVVYNKLAKILSLPLIDKPWSRGQPLLLERIEELKIKVKEFRERTVKAKAVELLCAVEYYENRMEPASIIENNVKSNHKEARSVGIPYDRIINMIKEAFPKCKTTVACLRWYSVKIRVEEHGYENLTLPQRRPRVKPTKKK